MKLADSQGDTVVIGGGMMDPKAIAKQYILSLDNRVGVGLNGQILPTPKSAPLRDYIENNLLMRDDAINYSQVKEILTKMKNLVKNF